MTVNFTTYGRQQYKGAGGGNYDLAPHRTSQGQLSHADWSWKPAPGEEGRSEAWFFEKLRLHVESLTKRQREEYRANQRAFAESHSIRLTDAERIFKEQMTDGLGTHLSLGVNRI